MVQRITNQSRETVHWGSSLSTPILIVLAALLMASCYTTIDRQNFWLSDAEALTDSRAHQVDDVPDLPVSHRLLASIPEYSNTLVLEGSLANFYSIRDFALDQHLTICHYDPIVGELGIRKQLPEHGLDLIMFYRISSRTIKVHAYWRNLRGRGSISQNMIDSLIRSTSESENAPVLWASADPAVGGDLTGIAYPAVGCDFTVSAYPDVIADPAISADLTISADRPVRRSNNPDSSEVSRGRVAEPRSTGNVRRPAGGDESSRRRDEVSRRTNDRSPKDHEGRESRRDDRGDIAPSIHVNPRLSPAQPESVRPSAPAQVVSPGRVSGRSFMLAILRDDVYSDSSIAFAHMLHFIHQSPYDVSIRYRYNWLDDVLPADHPCNPPRPRDRILQ